MRWAKGVQRIEEVKDEEGYW